MYNAILLALYTLAAAILFGIWQQSWLAGFFMFCALVVIDQR